MTRLLAVLVCAALALTACAGTTAERDPQQDPAPSPRTDRQAAKVRPVVVAVAGDIACEPGDKVTRTTCRQAATAKLARSLRPDRVIVLGDAQYPEGSLSDFRESYDRSWGKLRSRTWPVPGNHEYRTSGASGYFSYFAGRTPRSPGYYRRAAGGWQIFFLNSNCDKIDCAAEARWLNRQMTRHRARCQALVMHHPRFSSGRHGNSSNVRPFWRIGIRHRADLALAGHDHDYERFANAGVDGRHRLTGIQSFVAGAGGKSLYERETVRRNSRKFIDSTPGVLRLLLRPTGVTWHFYGIDGRVLDKGYRACH